MAGRNYRDFVRSVFEPLTAAADRVDLLDSLTTEAVAEDRKTEQFRRFKTFSVDLSDVVYLPNGGFAALYSHCGGRYLGISSAGLIAQDEAAIIEWASERHFEQSSLDECTFICFAHLLKGYYRLADRFRAPEEALNVIDVIDDEYSGHPFADLFSYYRPVLISQIPDDSVYAASDIFEIATDLCCNNEALRSAIIDDALAAVVLRLSEAPSVPNENLFQAITASHFRHAFLELYRCVESVFYLPWMLDLKAAGGIHSRACDLKETCRTALRWREKELPSMEMLFGLIPGDKELDEVEDAIALFKDIKSSRDFTRAQLGRRVYAIRNGMVHHEDYETSQQYKPNDVQWKFLSLYLALVLVRITSTYERDLTPALKDAVPVSVDSRSEQGGTTGVGNQDASK